MVTDQPTVNICVTPPCLKPLYYAKKMVKKFGSQNVRNREVPLYFFIGSPLHHTVR